MSNLTIILTSILLSFLVCAIFMSAYKEDRNDILNGIISAGKNNAKLIKRFADELDILRVRVYDLENKIKEMESKNDR